MPLLAVVAGVGGFFLHRALTAEDLVPPAAPPAPMTTSTPAPVPVATNAATPPPTATSSLVAPAGATPVPGLAWLGREWTGGGWDFLAVATELTPDKAGVLYRFEATPIRGTGGRRGTLEVRTSARRIRGVLRMPDRSVLRIYEATSYFVAGRAFAIGQAYDEDEPRVRAPFWATLEKAVPSGPQRVALNEASVAELEALGLSPRSARTVAEGRIVWKHYKTPDEALAAPDLTEREREVLRAQTFVP